MPIFEYNKLKKEQIEDITELVCLCNAYEGLKRKPVLQNENLYEDMNCYYLYYKRHKLISVLVIDQLRQAEAEITAYTLPGFRRQGYFYKILEKALDELAYFNIYKILMVVEPKSISGEKAARELGKYEYSEYMLQHDLAEINKEYLNHKVSFNEVNNIQILEELFNTNSDEDVTLSIDAAKTAIYSENMICLIADINNEVAGFCNISLESNPGYLFGLYIIDKFRRQGIGYTFVHQMLEISYKNGKNGLILQVGNNAPALNLYLKIGFNILEQLDYYVMYTQADEDLNM